GTTKSYCSATIELSGGGESLIRPFSVSAGASTIWPAMIDAIEIKPASEPVSGRIRPPGSKSITNRALICAALADGASTLRGALASEDTAVMIDSLRRLGISIEQDSDGRVLRVRGSKGEIPSKDADL